MNIRFSSFAESYEIALPLIKEHAEEIGFGPWKDLDLHIDTTVYKLLEQEGLLRVIVAEDEGKMVGYFMITCGNMPHFKDLWKAGSDVIYVDPEYRSSGIAARMIKLMMEDCKDHDISFLSIGVSTNLDFSEMLEKNGAVLTEKQYTWRL